MTRRRTKIAPWAVIVTMCLMMVPSFGLADEATIAVAANFTAAAKDIASAFHSSSENSKDHRVILAYGSTGKLYAQIAYGAPFDAFLAADAERPQKTEAEGLAVAGSRFTYAKGKIVLYSADPDLITDGPDVLSTPDAFRKIAIANPITAPYGVAAVEALKNLKVYEGLHHKLVRGDNIAQTHQFVATKNAQLGFVAYAQVIGKQDGSMWVVSEYLYAPIHQDAVLLKRGEQNQAARAFLDFLKSDAARTIIARYGYGLE